MQRSVSATEARVHFGDMLQRVTRDRETIIVERGGVPPAVVLSVAEYESLLARGATTGWRTQARAARELVLAELGTTPIPPAEEIISATRQERDEQLDGVR